MKDIIFGELTFSIGWNKKQYVEIFNKEIGIRVDCYENELPNKKQQNTYNYFLENQKEILIILEKELYTYIFQNKQSITSEIEVFNFVEIKEILFLDDGKYLLTFTTSWNTHNSAILFDGDNKIIVATEDIVANYL